MILEIIIASIIFYMICSGLEKANDIFGQKQVVNTLLAVLGIQWYDLSSECLSLARSHSEQRKEGCMEKTKIQEAIIATRTKRMALEDKSSSPHDMTATLIKKPTAGKAIQEFCRMCSNFDANVRYHCEMRSGPLWLFRQGKSTMSEEDLRAYVTAVDYIHDRIEDGAKPCPDYHWVKTKNTAEN